MITDTNAWLGGAFWRDRDATFAHFQIERERKKIKAQKIMSQWLWPGANHGIRPPEQDETPLSVAEVKYLRSEVCFD